MHIVNSLLYIFALMKIAYSLFPHCRNVNIHIKCRFHVCADSARLSDILNHACKPGQSASRLLLRRVFNRGLRVILGDKRCLLLHQF